MDVEGERPFVHFWVTASGSKGQSVCSVTKRTALLFHTWEQAGPFEASGTGGLNIDASELLSPCWYQERLSADCEPSQIIASGFEGKENKQTKYKPKTKNKKPTKQTN